VVRDQVTDIGLALPECLALALLLNPSADKGWWTCGVLNPVSHGASTAVGQSGLTTVEYWTKDALAPSDDPNKVTGHCKFTFLHPVQRWG